MSDRIRRAILVLAVLSSGCASVWNYVDVTRADMSNYEKDRQVCAWESYISARCSYGGSVCMGDPRDAYKLCMYKLGYTVEGLKP